jgi:hypothetical protein
MMIPNNFISGNSSIFQTDLMSLWILLESVLPEFGHYLMIYTFLNFAIAVSTSRRLGPGTDGSSICTSICVTVLTLCTFNNRKVVLPPILNVVGVCKQITNLIPH